MQADDLTCRVNQLFISLRHVEPHVSHLQPDVLHALDNALLSTLVNIRGVTNSQCTINRLPPEILGDIFYLVPYTVVDLRGIWPTYVVDPRCVQYIALVCRHWYNVAKAYSCLWSSITCSQTPDLYLQRSRGTPLDVYVPENNDSWKHFLKILRSGRPIRELDIYCSWLGTSALGPESAPDLEVLTLNRWREQGTIFQDHTPRLRQLSLHQSSIPRNTFPSLLRLSLYDTTISLDDFLPCLASSPRLEDLAIVHGSVQQPLHLNPPRKIHLACLRTLVINALPQELEAEAILSQISVGPAAAISVESYHDHLIAPSLHIDPDFDKLSLWSPSTQYACVTMAGAMSAIETSSDNLLSDVWYLNVISNFPLHRIREFWVESIGNFEPHLATQIYRSMTALETLVLYVEHSARSLEPFISDNHDDLPLCPRLSTLHLLIDDAGLNNGALIHEFIMTRARRGHPISKIVMETRIPVDEEGIIDSLASYVEDICIRSVEVLSTMTLPAICTVHRHGFWGPWVSGPRT